MKNIIFYFFIAIFFANCGAREKHVVEKQTSTPAISETPLPKDTAKNVSQQKIIIAAKDSVKEKTVVENKKSFLLVAGVFKSKVNAEKLAKELKTKNCKAFISPAANEMFKVFAGKFAEKSEAEKEIERLKTKMPKFTFRIVEE